MNLPPLELPVITLPFDIPLLSHPSVVHFLIALPVIVLLLEIMNLLMGKKAVGGVSFFLLLLTVLFAVLSYLTGVVDGKEAYPMICNAAQDELAEHKLIGTYVMLASFGVLFFKLLSMLTRNMFFKGIYLLVLIGYVLAIFTQGKEGGELVYQYGLNVHKVKVLDDKVFDLEDKLEDLTKTSVTVEKSEVTTVLPTVLQQENNSSMSL